MNILVTGGAGYIGTHTTVELLNEGYHVTIVDNLSNSHPESIQRVLQITGKTSELKFVKADLCDLQALDQVFANSKKFDAVIHFAGLKAVGESVAQPLRYYENNIYGTLNLLKVMEKYGCCNLVFSSSATVYGDPSPLDSSKITEEYPLKATNPYGRTKLFIEDILRDVAISQPKKWKIVLLRYFNPIGAHPSGLIGEDPNGIPNNLTPFILQVAVGRRPHLQVFGKDYPTEDGTGVRDYIHVVDLAAGHLAALGVGIFGGGMKEDCEAFNLGTGRGVSVLEMVDAFKRASGKEIPYKVGDRRPGDVATCVAWAQKAKQQLGWQTKLSLDQACQDGWKWQSLNPNGYKKA